MSARASQRILPPDFPANAQPEGEAAAARWWLYLLECGDGSWYAGISNDLDARLRAHAAGKGARYTRGRGPLRLLASRGYPDRAEASRAEWALKRLPKAGKLAFFAHGPGEDGGSDGGAPRDFSLRSK